MPRCMPSTFFLLFVVSTELAALAAEAPSVSLSVELNQARYYLNEPLVLTATFTNLSGQNIEGHFCASPWCELATVSYRRRPAGFRPYQRPLLKRTFEGREGTIFVDSWTQLKTLKPGATLQARFSIALDAHTGAAVLAAPGKHDFLLRYEDIFNGDTIRLTSNTVQVQVLPPPAHEHAALSDYGELLSFIQGSFAPPNGMAPIEAFLEKHGTSLYARHVRNAALRHLLGKIRSATATRADRALYHRLKEQAGRGGP